MEKGNTRRVILAVLGLVLVAGLCAATAAGGFYLGRNTAASAEVEIAEVGQEPEELLEAAEATVPVLPETEPEEEVAEVTPEALEAEEVEEDPSETLETEPLEEEVGTPAVVEPEETEVVPALARDTAFSEEDLQIMWEAWEILEREFDGELPDDETLSYAVIRGMIEALDDDFTAFAPPDVAERMREDLQGAFEGIGAFVRENEEGLTEIVRPMDGQPADLAGLEAGDVVVGVDGESVVDRSLDEVIALIRGPRGTEVTLTVERESLEDPFDVTVVRDRVEIPIIESEMLEDQIGYVRLTSFNRNADAQLREALSELLAQDPQGLIFDLRDNPGGFLDQSIAVADAFLAEEVVLYERSMTLGVDEVYRSDDGDLAEAVPLVVLVNAGSASASEIVAGAIRDHERGILIGETTFGKGSVQQTHTLSDGSELRVTIARWYIPSNQSIDGTGIEPDIEVETPDDLGGEEDVQLERAIEYLLENRD